MTAIPGTGAEQGPLVLDGARLARERVPGLAARAAAVTRTRGHAPRLGLVAFAPDDRGPAYVPRKVRACEAAGVAVLPLLFPWSASTDEVRSGIARMVAAERVDGIFVEFPFPDGVDGDAVVAEVPETLDVDVMTEGRVRRYLDARVGPPPVTVSAALELLDAFDVDVAGRAGVVVAEPSPFTIMFREALARRGARMAPLLAPRAPDLAQRLAEAGLVVAAASSPGVVTTADLAAGVVAIDVGYFNAGGRGDIDLSPGTAHLGALAPVPGAIGPMTVSVLVERVIAFAEGREE